MRNVFGVKTGTVLRSILEVGLAGTSLEPQVDKLNKVSAVQETVCEDTAGHGSIFPHKGKMDDRG